MVEQHHRQFRVVRVGGPGLERRLAAGRDRVVDNEAIRRFCAAATGVSLAVIPDARHEIMFERDSIREQFFAAFEAFTT
jgi:alpha-beta hydrolase superfamily lysophospholipase